MNNSGDEDYDNLFKLVLIGDMGVGKTHLMERYKTGQTPQVSPPTIGVEFSTKIVYLRNGQGTVRAQIWDTAGQERYRSMVKLQYQRAQGAFMVYDVTKRGTFESIKNYWL